MKTSGSETKIAATYEKYAPNTTRVVVSFTYTNTDDDILFRTYDINTGSSPSITYISETTVPGTTTGTQQKSDIAINKNGYVIVSWTDLNSNNIKYKIYKNDGTVLQTDTNANTYSITTTATSSVATDKQLQYAELDENKFIITYDAQINANGDNGIATKIITYQAICSESTELIVNDTSNPTENSANPEVSADFMGNYTIVWEQPTYDGSQTLINKDIEGQSYNNTGKKVGSNFQVNTIHTTNYQTHPAISMNEEGTYNITFTENSADIYIKKYNTEIFKVNTEDKQNSSTTGTQSKTDTKVSPTGNTATVWKDDNDNSIKLTLKDSTDTVIVQDQIIYTSATADNPKIAFYKNEEGSNVNKFIVTWQAAGASDTDIFYRTYTAAGTAEISATVVNTPTTNNQTYPVIDTGYSPYFTIGWKDDTYKIDSAFYNGTSFSQINIETCSSSDPCNSINLAQEATNNYIIFTWRQGTTTKSYYLKEASYTTSYQTIGTIRSRIR